MSKEVKRYDPFGYDGLSALMHEDVLGDYVSWDDYDALRTELTEANADFVRIANEREALIAERDRLRDALEQAAQSLESISKLAGRDEFMQDVLDIRGFANSRANVARAALQGEQP
mgnify:CR=1 FL=1